MDPSIFEILKYAAIAGAFVGGALGHRYYNSKRGTKPMGDGSNGRRKLMSSEAKDAIDKLWSAKTDKEYCTFATKAVIGDIAEIKKEQKHQRNLMLNIAMAVKATVPKEIP